MEIFIQILFNGILLGGMYSIISVGLTLIFGVIRVTNFAHGELLMIGMYAVYLLSTLTGLSPYMVAVPAVLLLFVLGVGMQRFIIQPLLLKQAAPEIQIFATVGVSTALMNLALLVFGANMYSLKSAGMPRSISIGNITFIGSSLIVFLCAVLLILGLHLFMSRTYFGWAIRATAQNSAAASLMGINVKKIYLITFGIGSACTGLAAALIMPMYSVFPSIGTYFVLTAFVTVVMGGMGSIPGAFIGALIIGVVDALSGYYIAPDLKEVVYFLLFILILIIRPTGLFGFGSGSE